MTDSIKEKDTARNNALAKLFQEVNSLQDPFDKAKHDSESRLQITKLFLNLFYVE